MTDPIVTMQTPNLYGPAQSFGLTNRYDYKGLDPELALAERAADQRQLIANAILNQSSVPRRGKMVGRLYQKAHWAEGLGQLGEAAAGMYLSNKIQEDRAKAEDKSQTAQAAELEAYRQAINPRAATGAEMVPNIRGANAGKIAEAMLAQSGVAPLKGQYAPQAPGAYQVAQFDQPRAEVDPAVQAQADEQAAAQAAYAVNPNAGGYNMNNAPEAVMNPAPAPAASMTRPEVPSVDLAQQAGMLERPAQAAFTPTPQQERAAIAALRTSQFAANREYGKDEMTRLRDEQTQRNVEEARRETLAERRDEFQARQNLAKDAAADKKEYQLRELEYKRQAATERAENTALSLQQRKDAQAQSDDFKQQWLDLRKQMEKDRRELEQDKRDEKQQKVTGGRDDVSYMIGKMEKNVNELNDLTAIPSTENSSLGNLRASASNSGLGRSVGQVFGTTAQTVRDKNKSLIPGLLLSIKQATGSSARSFDSNKELDFYIGILGDDKSTAQAQLEALGHVKRLYGSRKESGPPGVPPPAADGRPVKISSEDEYDKLDTGTVYMKPDGLLYRKK